MEDQEIALEGILGAITEIRKKQLQDTEQILKELNAIVNKPAFSPEELKAVFSSAFQRIYIEVQKTNEEIQEVRESVNIACKSSDDNIITEIKKLLIKKGEADFVPKTRFDKFRYWLKSYAGIDLSPACLFICLETALIALLIVVNSYVVMEKRTYKNNDLKYRYILIQGEATGKQLEYLQSIFYRQDNGDIIRQIRDSVCDFEYRCEKRAEAIERSRLLQEQAEQLKQEAEQIRIR